MWYQVLERPQSDYTRKPLAAVPKLRISGSADVASCSNRSMDPETTIAGEGIAKTFPVTRSVLYRKSQENARFAIYPSGWKGVRSQAWSERVEAESPPSGGCSRADRASAGEFRIGEDAFDASRSGARSGLLGRVQMIFQDPAVSLNPA